MLTNLLPLRFRMNPFVLSETSTMFAIEGFKNPGGPPSEEFQHFLQSQGDPPYPEKKPFPRPPGHYGPDDPINYPEEEMESMSPEAKKRYLLRMILKFERYQELYLHEARLQGDGPSGPVWQLQASRAFVRGLQFGKKFLTLMNTPVESGDVYVRLYLMRQRQAMDVALRNLGKVQRSFAEFTAALLHTWDVLEPADEPPHFSRAMERMGITRLFGRLLVGSAWILPTEKRFLGMMRPFVGTQERSWHLFAHCQRFYHHLTGWYRVRYQLQEHLFDFRSKYPFVPLDQLGDFGTLCAVPPHLMRQPLPGAQKRFAQPPPFEMGGEQSMAFFTSDKVPLARLSDADSRPALGVWEREQPSRATWESVPPPPARPLPRRRVLSPTPTLFSIFLHLLLLFSSVAGAQRLSQDSFSDQPSWMTRNSVMANNHDAKFVSDAEFATSMDTWGKMPLFLRVMLSKLFPTTPILPTLDEIDPALWMMSRLPDVRLTHLRDVYLASGSCHRVETTLRLLGPGPIRTFSLKDLKDRKTPVLRVNSVLPLEGQVTVPWYQRASHAKFNLSQEELLTKFEEEYHHKWAMIQEEALNTESKGLAPAIELSKEAYDPLLPIYLEGRLLFKNTTFHDFTRTAVLSATKLSGEELDQLQAEITQVFSLDWKSIDQSHYDTMMDNFLLRPEIRDREYRKIPLGILFDLTPEPIRNTQYCVIQPTPEGDAMVVIDERLRLEHAKELSSHLELGPRLAYSTIYCRLTFCTDLHGMTQNYTKVEKDGYFCLFPEIEECLYQMVTPDELFRDPKGSGRKRNSEEPSKIDWDDPKWKTLMSPKDRKRLREQDQAYQDLHPHRGSLFHENNLEELLRTIQRTMVIGTEEGNTTMDLPDKLRKPEVVSKESEEASERPRDKRAFVHHTTEMPSDLSLDERNRNVVVYDCSQPKNIEPVSVDLRETSCKPSGPVIRRRSVELVLLQKTRKERITVYRCRILQSTVPVGCGMHSHQWLYLPYVQIEVPLTVDEDECRKMHRSQKFVDLHGERHTLELNSLNTINLPVTGQINVNGGEGHCSPGVGTFNGRHYNKMVLHHYYKIWIEELPAEWDEETGYITPMAERVTLSCHSNRGVCIKGDDVYFWSPPEDEPRCPYYKARHSKGVIAYGSDATTYMSEDGSLIRLVLKGQYTKTGPECKHGQIWATNYEDLFVTEEQDNDFFKRKVAIESLSLAMYVNLQDSVVLSMVEERIEQEHSSILEEDCKRRASVSQMDYASIMAEQVRPVEGTMAALGGGFFIEHAGDLFYKFSCKPYLARVRYAEGCFGNLPITLSREDEKHYRAARGELVTGDEEESTSLELFMQPRSHLLTRIGIAQECRPDMAPIYQGAYGDFIQYTPGSAVKILEPNKLQLKPREIKEASRLWVQTDFEAGGIYDHQTVRKMDDRASLGPLVVDVGRQWAQEAMRRQYQSRASRDEDFSGGFLRSSFMTITSFFSFFVWWGDVVSGFLGLITLIQIGSWLFSLFLRCSSPPFHPAAGLMTRMVTALFPSAIRFLSQFARFGGGQDPPGGTAGTGPASATRPKRNTGQARPSKTGSSFASRWLNARFHKVPQNAELAEAQEMRTVIRREPEVPPAPDAPQFSREAQNRTHNTFYEEAAATDAELRALVDRPPPPTYAMARTRLGPRSPQLPSRRPGSPVVVTGNLGEVYHPLGNPLPALPPLTVVAPEVSDNQWEERPTHTMLLMELEKMKTELEGGNEALARIPATRRNALISQVENHCLHIRSKSSDLDLNKVVEEIRVLKRQQEELTTMPSRGQMLAQGDRPFPPPPSSTPV